MGAGLFARQGTAVPCACVLPLGTSSLLSEGRMIAPISALPAGQFSLFLPQKNPAQQKTPERIVRAFSSCWHLPIFPGRHQPSIIGTSELNFCVRNGNRWTLAVINTNFSLPFSGQLSYISRQIPVCQPLFPDFFLFRKRGGKTAQGARQADRIF